jgi:hypothetical protein
MTSLADVIAQAYNAAALPTLKRQQVNTDAAIYKFWLANRDIGVPLTAEIPLDDGTTAVIFSTGKVAHWLSGESVELV